MGFGKAFTNKYKILNDPIYGFITIPSELIFDLLEHPYFQRLRRISQLGLSYLVYPGAYHTRFHHALGALHLMQQAVNILRSKGHEITEEEQEAVQAAILLHDIGHGPFSHALEHSIVSGIRHEKLSLLFMERLNKEFSGQLDLAIRIFRDQYEKKFLHQLISSQLDMDRLDYLRRDSFYTGVSEGQINSERLLTMLNVADDELVIDAKGIYSVEKFIIARRLMYWQVYLHKTVLSAEFLLVQVLRRAKELAGNGTDVFASSALQMFLKNNYGPDDFERDAELLNYFSRLDDFDILGAIKEWQFHPDPVLSILSTRLVQRRLLRIEIRNEPFDDDVVPRLMEAVKKKFGYTRGEEKYLVIRNSVDNHAYDPARNKINLLFKSGKTRDVVKASDQLNLEGLARPVTKHFICYPKEVSI